MSASNPRKVIGIDLGGSKLLAGVIDEELEVSMRVHRGVQGLGQGEIIDVLTEAVEEAKAAEPQVEAVGMGLPCLIDQRTGTAVLAINLPIANLPFRDIMRERLDIPVFIDNDANV